MFQETALPGVIEVRPRRFGDERGFLSETFNAERYRAGGVNAAFIQDNISHSRQRGTVRGLHFQIAPHGQAKLVSCLAGRILDVAVDIRPGSPTLGHFVAIELDSELGNQLFVPDGYAHGFCTLGDNCLVTYKLSSAYAPDAERAVAFDDPALGINWPVTRSSAHLSDRDAKARTLSDVLAERGAMA